MEATFSSELPRPQGGASKKIIGGGLHPPYPCSAFIPVHRTGYSAGRFYKVSKFKCLFLFFAFCLSIFLAGASSIEAADQIVLKAAYYQPVGNSIFELGKESLSNVEKLTNGRVKFVLYPNSTLVPTTEMATAVDEGTAFCANWYMPYMAKTIPLFNIEVQAIWTSGDSQTVQSAYEEGINDLYTEALHRQGLKNTKVAGVSQYLWRALATKKVVHVPSDVKGMKIRSVGAEADMLKAIGASPVNIIYEQTYEAVSRGIADGCTNVLIALMERGLLEQLKYVLHLDMTPVLMHIIYNTKELEKLDPRDRPIVEKAMKDLAAHSRDGRSKMNEIAMKEASKKFGTVFYYLTPAERELWVKGAASTVRDFTSSTDPLIQKALSIVYKSNPPK